MAPPRRVVLAPGEIPYVSPDGGTTRYYADRYYLDAPTALPEYQSDLNNNTPSGDDNAGGGSGRRHSSKNTSLNYCNKCGELMRSCEHDTRGTSTAQQCWPPLFDRAKFINSLDLSAAIISTFSIGDLEYLSEEFPRLFPLPHLHRSKSNQRNRQYVPTLVLHGQRGFNLEKWSCSNRNSIAGANEEMKSTTAKRREVDEPMELRGGGGGECSSPSSDPSTIHATTIPEQSCEKCTMKSPPPSSSKTKRPCFTYGSQQLNLPRTPLKRMRTSRKKLPPTSETSSMKSTTTDKSKTSPTCKDTANNCRDLNDTSQTGRNVLNLEVIEIDSNSDADDADDGNYVVARPKVHDNATNTLRRDDTSHSKESRSFPTHIAADTKSHDVNGIPPRTKETTYMQSSPLANDAARNESSAEISADITPNKLGLNHDRQKVMEERDNQPTVAGWGGVTPATVFGGEVFFTQILPRWRPPQPSKGEGKGKESSRGTGSKKRGANSKSTTASIAVVNYSDDTSACIPTIPEENNEEDEEDPEITTTAGGVHHPKFFLLFETSGSVVVIVSTSNLTPQQALEGSWVQRFEPHETSPRLQKSGSNGCLGGGSFSNANGFVDYGMPSDFGAILMDFLTKQSDAAALGGMLPDVFLRRYVPGLSSGLSSLAETYRFSDAQVHLVSTVPGDYVSSIPKNAHRDPSATKYKPRISYGPQRVSFILSRILNSGHIRSARIARAANNAKGCRMEADTSWFPPSLIGANDRLVMQPTSLGGNWTRDDLEVVVQAYLRPHWESARDTANDSGTPMEDDNGPLNVMDIVWPSMECIDTLSKQRRSILENYDPELAADSSANKCTAVNESPEGNGRDAPLFLSSISFAKLDRSCISRLSLFTHVSNRRLPYTSASIHFKSICRLLRLTNNNSADKRETIGNNQQIDNDVVPSPKEYLSWFMLTSACLSRGAQGRPTPHSDPATDSMSYMNFELGILFCSRLMGDNVHDRIYLSDPEHTTMMIGCQCGKGARWYKSRFIRNGGGSSSSSGGGGDNNTNTGFLDSVRKVHLPVPYRLRPMPYRTDPDSDLMDYTPYMHSIPPGTECVGNMKLTPFGRRKMELSSA
jgi:hypothetical protein